MFQSKNLYGSSEITRKKIEQKHNKAKQVIVMVDSSWTSCWGSKKNGYGLDLGVWERMKQTEKWKALRKV
jgi:hypothetical protein